MVSQKGVNLKGSRISYDVAIDLVAIASTSNDRTTVRLLQEFVKARVDTRSETKELNSFDTQYLEDVAVLTTDTTARQALADILIKYGKGDRTWTHLMTTSY